MINRTRLSLVSAAVLVAGPALNAAAQTVSLGRAAIAAPSMVMGLNSTVQSATPGLTPMVMPSLLAATIIPSAPALVVARAEITPTAQLTTVPQGLNLDKPGAVQELSAHLNSMYEGALAPDGGSSGNVWTTDMLNAFVNDHGTALRAVPGVLNAVVAPSLARKPASLTIFVDSSVELATVKKAVEKAVPDIERLYGIMGAPNQVLYSQVDPAYSHLTLTNIMPLFQDGGAIVLEGNLSKSVKATIRMDLAINSQTYGQFFVVEKTWNLPTPAERKMTASELNGLGWTVAKHLINTPDDPFRVLYLKLLAAISSP